MRDCIFCKIVKKELKAEVFFEDGSCLAFAPLKPIVNGHVLVAPKVHFENIFDINEEVLKKLIVVGKKVARGIVKKQNATGINFLHASGRDAQQSVLHFHFHIVPRRPNDGLDLWFSGLAVN